MDLIVTHADDDTFSTLQLQSPHIIIDTSNPKINLLIDDNKTYIFTKDGFYLSWVYTDYLIYIQKT
jgi:hypothetical protein